MARARQSVALSEDEAAAFLADQRKVQVATIGQDGTPHLTTLFYVVVQGRIAFWTYASSQKIANLRRNPRVTCLVEDGEDYFELRGVSLTGTATLIEEYDDVRALGVRVLDRMAGGDGLGELGQLGADLVDAQARKRVGVVITADRVSSWDHRKLNALPGRS